MDKPGTVVDLEEERVRLAVDQLFEDVKRWKGFDIDLDVSKTMVHFTGHASGNHEDLEGEDRLRVIVYDTSGEHVRAIGALGVNRRQWIELKKLGDTLLGISNSVSGKEIVCTQLFGKISSVVPGGNFGIVKLDRPMDGLKYGVIGDETEGRIALMNPTGKLEVETRVQIRKVRKGLEAFAILQILAAKESV